MTTALRRRMAVVALVGSLLTVSVGLAAPVSASSGAGTSAAVAANIIDDGAAMLKESKAVQWLLDQIAIVDLQLTPMQKQFVNWLIKLALPVMCPVLGQAAAPQYSDAIVKICLGFGNYADPWQKIVDFAPWLCGFGWLIFPDYVNVLSLGCKALL